MTTAYFQNHGYGQLVLIKKTPEHESHEGQLCAYRDRDCDLRCPHLNYEAYAEPAKGGNVQMTCSGLLVSFNYDVSVEET